MLIGHDLAIYCWWLLVAVSTFYSSYTVGFERTYIDIVWQSRKVNKVNNYLILPTQLYSTHRKLHFGTSHVKIILKMTTFQAK